MEAPVATPAAPVLPQAVQLNEDAQLRVLSGRTTYVAEAKKKKDEEKKEEEKVDEGKTEVQYDKDGKRTGVKHTSTHKYSDEPHAEPKSGAKSKSAGEKKKEAPEQKKSKTGTWGMEGGKKFDNTKKESYEGKFAKMVEAKKGSKPDFLDMDKDGDKKEPMKKAIADKKKGAGEEATGDYSAKKGAAGKDLGKPGKNFAKIAKKAGKEYGSKEKGEKVAGAVLAKLRGGESKMMPKGKKRPVKESIENILSFKDMIKLVQESGGQQQIDAVDQELFSWAQRVAKTKLGEGLKAEVYAGMVYERMGGRFEMYDVLSVDQK